MRNESKFGAQLKTWKNIAERILLQSAALMNNNMLICTHQQTNKWNFQVKGKLSLSYFKAENPKNVCFHHHQNILTFKFIYIFRDVCIYHPHHLNISIYVAVGPIMLIEYGRVKRTLSSDPACQWKWELYKLVKTKNPHSNNWNTKLIVLPLDDSKLEVQLKIKGFLFSYWNLQISCC